MTVATIRYARCARLFDSLSRIELELESVWEEAYTDLPLPDRDDELADFAKAQLERVRALKESCRAHMQRNRNAALRSE